MNNHKWLIRLIYVLSIATLILIIYLGINFAITADKEIKKLQDSINTIEEYSKSIKIPKDGYTPIKNIDYFDGKDGKDGRDGKNGTDSVSTHTETVKEVPINGKDGKDGKDGLTPEVYIDQESCLLMTRYGVDESWTIQAQLPKPCEVQ